MLGRHAVVLRALGSSTPIHQLALDITFDRVCEEMTCCRPAPENVSHHARNVLVVREILRVTIARKASGCCWGVNVYMFCQLGGVVIEARLNTQEVGFSLRDAGGIE
jgi:hypothetical protein